MPSTSHQSPILCESAPPPPHTWSNPNLTIAQSASPTPETQVDSAAVMSDRQMQDETTQGANTQQEDSSSSDTGSDISAETPRTASTPRSDPVPLHTQDSSSDAQMEMSTTDLPEPRSQVVSSQREPAAAETGTEQPTAINDATIHEVATPPPPPPLGFEPPPPRDDIPDWVKYEEDLSTPNDEELREIEAKTKELNAKDVAAVEKSIFADMDDPELRPVKKLRMSWTIKGVRGTREKPNRARIMISPTFHHEGLYWNVKFFPRGNKSRSSLAAFIRCSNVPLQRTSEDNLEGTFKCYAGAADETELEEKMNITLSPLPPDPVVTKDQENETAIKPSTPPTTAASDSTSPELILNHTDVNSGSRWPTQVVEDNDSSDDSDSDDGSDELVPAPPSMPGTSVEDFRVSAQLGMVISNPEEPRTCYDQSSEHQFCPHEDDWGWDSVVSRWEEIHRRKHGQRQALLRNDTLVIDAYVRVFDDPSKALFWHSSAGETQWDSKLLAGYYPMGTRLLYHSPAVAGITAWCLLAPFRKLIQSVDAGCWRTDTTAKPRPLLANLQMMLFQMRHMKKEETYIHLDNVICEVIGPGEKFEDVKTFWEVFRRSIELELEGDEVSIACLSEVFGPTTTLNSIPKLPVQDVHNIQRAVDKAFETVNFRGALPNFLPLMLDRQSFDTSVRDWKLYHDRVRLSDEIDCSRFCTETDAKYTLYGFVVHDGERNSGKFYSVVRPAGPGGKWLAFSDGNGNKVFSYTRKSLEEFEGLEGNDLKNFTSTRQTVYMAMYIRTSCLKDYLIPSMEDYRLPIWLKPYIEESYYETSESFNTTNEIKKHEQIDVELFWDASILGHEGTLNMYNMKSSKQSRSLAYHQRFTCHPDATFQKLKEEIGAILQVEETAVRLWSLNFHRMGQYSKAYMHMGGKTTSLRESVTPGEVLSLWLTIVLDGERAADDTFKDRFLRLGGIHVEAPPSIHQDWPILDLSGSNSEMPDIFTIAETLDMPTTETPNQNNAADITESARQTSGDSVITSEEGMASADAEQASVAQAVAADVQQSANATGVIESPRTMVNANGTAHHLISLMQAVIDSATVQEAGPSENELAANVSDAVTQVANAPSVEHDIPNDANIRETETITVPFANVTAASGQDTTVVTIETSLSEIPGDISAEDAALISSMIAADMEAAERERRNAERTRARSASRSGDENTISRPSTPRQPVAEIYGFLQFFDAEKQTIVTRKPFLCMENSKVGDVVRKQLQYDQDRIFQVWRRDGPCGTASIDLESTFRDHDLLDGCDVIVGDVLSDAKLEELRQKGDFSNPGHLIKYIVMSRHRHPVLSQTSSESVEIAEFGTDFYRGPLVRGQRHGQDCLLITSNGETYEGPMLAGQKSGAKGKMTYQNGDVYTGDWLNDLKHGQGEFVEKRTGNRYVGGYEEDKRWGRGVTYWEVADQQADLCQICYFQDVDALFYECGHVCACYNCAKLCDCCPVCRKSIRAVVKMYRS